MERKITIKNSKLMNGGFHPIRQKKEKKKERKKTLRRKRLGTLAVDHGNIGFQFPDAATRRNKDLKKKKAIDKHIKKLFSSATAKYPKEKNSDYKNLLAVVNPRRRRQDTQNERERGEDARKIGAELERQIVEEELLNRYKKLRRAQLQALAQTRPSHKRYGNIPQSERRKRLLREFNKRYYIFEPALAGIPLNTQAANILPLNTASIPPDILDHIGRLNTSKPFGAAAGYDERRARRGELVDRYQHLREEQATRREDIARFKELRNYDNRFLQDPHRSPSYYD